MSPPSTSTVPTQRTRRPIPAVLVLGAVSTVSLQAVPASAIPFERRFELRAEADTEFSLSSPNTSVYPVGFLTSVRLGVGLAEPVSLQIAVTEGIFPSSQADTSLNTFYHVGLRIEPRTVAPEGRLFAEALGGLDFTGPVQRYGFEVAGGWEFAISRYFQLGPVIRYGHIFRSTAANSMDVATAQFLGIGVSLSLRPFPPPRLRQGNLLAIDPLNAPDSDFDGVPDYLDQCPGAVEDHDGFQDDDGCPDLDDDNDGIPDAEDRCPRAPENFNGYEDDDGCPDERPEISAPIVFRGDQIRLQQRVYFGVERDRVPPTFAPILSQLARFLDAHPEIRRLRIEGHADDRGTRRHGFELSLHRAINIKNFLVEQGVDASRLEAVGYGDLRPLGTFHDEVTRAGNRRIEFVIVDGPAGHAPPPPPGVLTEASNNAPGFAPLQLGDQAPVPIISAPPEHPRH